MKKIPTFEDFQDKDGYRQYLWYVMPGTRSSRVGGRDLCTQLLEEGWMAERV
jgi:hypothetical protein